MFNSLDNLLLTTLFIIFLKHAEFIKLNFKDDIKDVKRPKICFYGQNCTELERNVNMLTSERLVFVKPDRKEKIATQFRLFSPNNKINAEFITNGNFYSHFNRSTNFNPKTKTKFILHGYMGGNAIWAEMMKDALIKQEKCNVFIVDWSAGDGPLYEQAVANVKVVGEEIGLFILHLIQELYLKPQDVHIIGHSLGSHGSGYAGKWLLNRDKNLKIGRITGLDPAGPYFNNVDRSERLDKGDASFVDVIHTNWASKAVSGFGLFEPIGHFDFYPNGGKDQPGCMTAGEAHLSIAAEILQILSPIWTAIRVAVKGPKETFKEIASLACSHSRAYEYFTASIRKGMCYFLAEQCSWWENYIYSECKWESKSYKTVQMGYYSNLYKHYVNESTHMKFFLRTGSTNPYCLEMLS